MAIGIQQTKEAINGILIIATVVAKHLKDGAQASDIVAVFNELAKDPAIVAELNLAVDKILDVPEEIKDIDLSEGLDIAKTVIEKIPALLEALKKS